MGAAVQIILVTDLAQMETMLQIVLFRGWLNLKFPGVARPLYVEKKERGAIREPSERDYARHCAARWNLALEPICRKEALRELE
ncbi:MAG: hypothetical protein DMG40_01265 [Acidobacteria bacterium]|nr:MAG: hypothetical protein DMG40_01265 [Acidobacteriota bacterium]